MSPLAQSIRKTLAFFDSQDIPLTLMDIGAYLVKNEEDRSGRITLNQITVAIQTELSDNVDHQNGFYFLSGRKDLVKLRHERYQISLRRFRKVERFLRILRFFPYLRGVAISGSQALLASDNDSDIDLFVITKKNRIWLARFLVSLYFQILGQRRHGKKIRSRFCLNHYLCEGRIINEDKNLYTAVEYASLLPVLGKEELRKFWGLNKWIGEFLVAPVLEKENLFFGCRWSRWQRFFEAVLDFTIGPVLNRVCGMYQKKRIKMQEHILVSDFELSFHPGSRGQKVLAEYAKKLV